MSRGPEGSFWKTVRRAWAPAHSQRVEVGNGDADAGTPDVVLSYMFRGGWIELKVWPEPLRPMQLPWHQDAIQRGAYARVLCRLDKSTVWLGTAEMYARCVRLRIKPKGVGLQIALGEIRSALS